MAISIGDLVEQGKKIQSGLKYVQSAPNVTRLYDVYAPADMNEYYRWKECAIKFLQTYYPLDKERFVNYSIDFETKRQYLPQFLSNMVGVIEACEIMPSEKVLTNEVYSARETEISAVEDLERAYLDLRKYGRAKINSAETIDAFHRWHAAACILFDKWFYSTEDDLQKFQNIASDGNGYTLSSEYNKIFTPYSKLMSRLKEGRELKRILRNNASETTGAKIDKEKVNVFISYSHEDAKWLEILKKHLKVLSRYSDNVDYWEDTKLKGGDKWKEEITKAIERANVAILLVSTDFLVSDFIANDELPPLLKKAEDSGTRILPLIVSPCAYSDSELGDFQAVNSPDKTLADIAHDDAAVNRAFLQVMDIIKGS